MMGAMTSEPGASIALRTLPNLRDIGGWRADDGVVVTGQFFRSTALSQLDDADKSTLESYGIRTVYDLRTAAERAGAPDETLDGATEIAIDVLADASLAIPANLGTILSDPSVVAKVRDELGDGKAATLIAGSYRDIVGLPSALASYRRLFLGLAGEDTGPALMHCTTGKDRTGWGAAAFLSLMGVPRADVFRDYLLTNEQLLPALASIFDGFAAAGGDPAILRPVLGVDRAYLEGAFDEVDSRFGGIEGYFTDGLGIDIATQKTLRERYIRRP